MPRKHRADKRHIPPDPTFNSELISKFINAIMKQGKKTVAEKVLYGALDIIAAKLKIADPLEIFEKSCQLC